MRETKTPSSGLFFAVGPDVDVTSSGERVAFVAGSRTVTFGAVGGATREALAQLGGEGAYEDQLVDAVTRSGGPDGLMAFYHCLGVLAQRRLLRMSVRLGGAPLLTLTPTSPGFRLGSRRIVAARRYALSRFVLLRADEGEPVLESPRAHSRVVLNDVRTTSILYTLARPRLLEEVCSAAPSLPCEITAQVMALLLNADMLVALDGAAPDKETALESWEFHDLLFHERSRSGGHGRPVGAAFPLAGRRPPPPSRRPPVEEVKPIALFRPPLDQLRRADPPYAEIQEARRSIRVYADQPISARQLGEFLYRVARVRETAENRVETPHGPVEMDFAFRPFPAGGALYELELYPVVRACEGLAPGMYHYEPHGHSLERISDGRATADLLAEAARAAGMAEDRLQALIIVAARFERMFWKYSGMGYATILKDVGCLYQTMYLAATAMGLAPCALGCGDSEAFAEASGNAPYTEGSVGEFLLGRAPAPRATPRPACGRGHSEAAKYDPLSQSSVASPHSAFRSMRQEDPVYWHPRHEIWFLTRFDDVARLAGDARFSATRERRDGANAPAALRGQLKTVEDFLARWMPLSDPPAHTRLRHAAAAVFTPRRIDSMRGFIEAEVDRCLDGVRQRDGMDVMADLALPLAGKVLARLLGVPPADIPVLKAWIKDAMALVSSRRATARSTALSFRGVSELTGYFNRHIAARREREGDDMWAVLFESGDLDEDTLAGMATVFVMGGYETVAYQIGNGLLALLQHPEELHKLREHPGLIEAATRELVRYDGAALQVMRRAGEDLQLHGVRIPRNAIVLGLTHAANRDPAHFADPDRLVIDRRRNRHLGFGTGSHACPGARLAQLQTQIAIGRLLEHFPRIDLTGASLQRVPSLTFHGLRSLPVRVHG